MILHDWVERLTEPGIVAKILHDGRKFYRFKKVPYMPVEFSAAAYRLGHSMVRQRYAHNKVFTGADFSLFFAFSGLSGGLIGDLAPNPPTPRQYGVSGSAQQLDHRLAAILSAWRQRRGARQLAPSRKLDPLLIKSLHEAAGRRRQPRFPQLEARRQSRPALGPGRGKAH